MLLVLAESFSNFNLRHRRRTILYGMLRCKRGKTWFSSPKPPNLNLAADKSPLQELSIFVRETYRCDVRSIRPTSSWRPDYSPLNNVGIAVYSPTLHVGQSLISYELYVVRKSAMSLKKKDLPNHVKLYILTRFQCYRVISRSYYTFCGELYTQKV